MVRSLEEAGTRFSQDLDKLSVSLGKAEDQYRSLEKKSLLEIEKERQNVIKLGNANSKLRDALTSNQEKHHKDMAICQHTISDLREKMGMLNGKVIEITGQQKETAARLKLAEKKLEIANSKPLRKTGPREKKPK